MWPVGCVYVYFDCGVAWGQTRQSVLSSLSPCMSFSSRPGRENDCATNSSPAVCVCVCSWYCVLILGRSHVVVCYGRPLFSACFLCLPRSRTTQGVSKGLGHPTTRQCACNVWSCGRWALGCVYFVCGGAWGQTRQCALVSLPMHVYFVASWQRK